MGFFDEPTMGFYFLIFKIDAISLKISHIIISLAMYALRLIIVNKMTNYNHFFKLKDQQHSFET